MNQFVFLSFAIRVTSIILHLMKLLSDQYIEPTNAYKVGSELKFKAKDRTNPTKFIPSVNADAGTNWFDIDTNLIYIVVTGTEPIDIRTTPVVQVNYTVSIICNK